MLRSTLLALALFAACSKSSTPPAGSNAPGAGTAAAGSNAAAPPDAPLPPPDALVIPPYTPAADVPEPIKAAIAAADRTDKDRALDAGRKPGEVFAFFKLAPGQKVGELFSGGGYSTELMARIVGDGGHVYAQNTKEVMEKFARAAITKRMAGPAMKPVTFGELPTEAPFPAEAKDLDAVICILNYHDFVWLKVDRAKANAAVFAALKPGGVYGIVDSSAADGSGDRDAETLHRIDRALVEQEITAAGFTLEASSDVLRNPDDKRDWNSSPSAAAERRGTSDRFVLRFVKPAKK
jgi:predicted methyltransferase